MTLPTQGITPKASQTYFSMAKSYIVTWGPKTIVVVVSGYYGLGLAYEYGAMAAIDKIAIAILKKKVGYAGVGALMPMVQWYAAWAVRASIALTAGILYTIMEKIYRTIHSLFSQPSQVIAQNQSFVKC